MKDFKLNRFWLTLRWVVSVSRRTLAMWTAGSAVGVFLFGMMTMWMGSEADPEVAVSTIAGICSAFIAIALLVGFCSILSGMDGKRERCAFLMLPATQLEKYLALLFYVTVVWTFCIVSAVVVGDTLRAVVRTVFVGEGWLSAVPRMCANMLPGNGSIGAVLGMVGFLAMFHSAYILGGTLLRRYAFVITSLAVILIIAACAYLLVWLGLLPLRLVIVVNGVRHVSLWYYVMEAGFWTVSLVNYLLSYHIFKHIELISNKWTNYDILKR